MSCFTSRFLLHTFSLHLIILRSLESILLCLQRSLHILHEFRLGHLRVEKDAAVTEQRVARTEPSAEIGVYESKRRSSADHSDHSTDGLDSDSDREMSLVVTRVTVRARDVLMLLRERLGPRAYDDDVP
jgi:hypothetical protein